MKRMNKQAVQDPAFWATAVPAARTYEWLTDCYRMRIDDEYSYSQNTRGLYQNEGPFEVVVDFLVFCKLAAERRAVPPGGAWDWGKFLAQASGDLCYAFEKSDAQVKYGQENVLSVAAGRPSLRYTAEVIYGHSCMADDDVSDAYDTLCDRCFDMLEEAYDLRAVAADSAGNPDLAELFRDVGGAPMWLDFYKKLKLAGLQAQAWNLDQCATPSDCDSGEEDDDEDDGEEEENEEQDDTREPEGHHDTLLEDCKEQGRKKQKQEDPKNVLKPQEGNKQQQGQGVKKAQQEGNKQQQQQQKQQQQGEKKAQQEGNKQQQQQQQQKEKKAQPPPFQQQQQQPGGPAATKLSPAQVFQELEQSEVIRTAKQRQQLDELKTEVRKEIDRRCRYEYCRERDRQRERDRETGTETGTKTDTCTQTDRQTDRDRHTDM